MTLKLDTSEIYTFEEMYNIFACCVFKEFVDASDKS